MLAHAPLLHAARLPGLQFMWTFTCGLGLSLLQHKLEEWHHLHAIPSVFDLCLVVSLPLLPFLHPPRLCQHQSLMPG
jgi:hypothetical protein